MLHLSHDVFLPKLTQLTPPPHLRTAVKKMDIQMFSSAQSDCGVALHRNSGFTHFCRHTPVIGRADVALA